MMGEWENVRLGDIVDVNQNTYSLKDKWDYINYLDTSNLIENKIETIQKLDCKQDKIPSRAKRKVHKNDILYSTVRPNQKHFGIIKKPVCNMLASTGFAVLSAKKNIADPSYIYWYLSQNHIVDYLHSIADNSTSTYPSLKPSDIETLKIHIPKSLSTQKEISTIFNNIHEKIENNNRINKILEEMAQAIFKNWFIDFAPVHAKANSLKNGGNDEQARDACICAITGKSHDDISHLKHNNKEEYQDLANLADAFPSSFTDSALGNIPTGWEVKTVDDCYNATMGQSPKGDSYNENNIGTLFYQGRAEFNWRFPTPRLYTTEPKRIGNVGDILMSVRAPVGDMNIALNDCCIGRGLCALRHKNNSTTYSYYQLLSIKNILDRFNGEGTVFGSINQNDLKSISIIEPSNNIIQTFIDRLTVFDNEIRIASIQNQTLAEIRDALLPKLLSGQIDVSHITLDNK